MYCAAMSIPETVVRECWCTLEVGAVQVECSWNMRLVPTAWFQPVNLKCDFLVFKVCFPKFNLHRYIEELFTGSVRREGVVVHVIDVDTGRPSKEPKVFVVKIHPGWRGGRAALTPRCQIGYMDPPAAINWMCLGHTSY
jgi:hypothetical protein